MTQNYSQNSTIASWPKCDSLTDSEQEYLIENSQAVNYQKGDLIIKQNSPSTHAIFIDKGLVKTIKESPNGRSNILEITGEKKYLGVLPLLSNNSHNFTAIALTNIQARFTPREVFMKLIYENRKYANKIFTETAESAQKTINRLVTINNKQLPGRVADVILYFLELYKKTDSFEFPLTRNELAQFSGTTKESFIRTLTEFKNDKIINIDGKNIQINSMEIIKTLSRLG